MQPESVVHVRQNSGCKEPGEDIRHGIACMPDCHAHRVFLLGIPRRCYLMPVLVHTPSILYQLKSVTYNKESGKVYGDVRSKKHGWNLLSVMPGKNGASASPIKNRQTANPAPLDSISRYRSH